MKTTKTMLKLKNWLRRNFIELICKRRVFEISDKRFEVLFTILVFKLKMTSFLNNPDEVNVRKEFKNYISVYLFGISLLHFKFYTNRILSFSIDSELYTVEDELKK